LRVSPVARHNHCVQPLFTTGSVQSSDDANSADRGEAMSGEQREGPPGDPSADALANLVTELDRCLEELTQARTRAEHLLRERRSGRAWLDIVSGEDRPLVVERISTVLASLATVGHAWRREQAVALRREDVSINRIAALFGVTRQRISALLKEPETDPEEG
jgi:hypothetical protein